VFLKLWPNSALPCRCIGHRSGWHREAECADGAFATVTGAMAMSRIVNVGVRKKRREAGTVLLNRCHRSRCFRLHLPDRRGCRLHRYLQTASTSISRPSSMTFWLPRRSIEREARVRTRHTWRGFDKVFRANSRRGVFSYPSPGVTATLFGRVTLTERRADLGEPEAARDVLRWLRDT
jgi:hypothetical protein